MTIHDSGLDVRFGRDVLMQLRRTDVETRAGIVERSSDDDRRWSMRHVRAPPTTGADAPHAVRELPQPVHVARSSWGRSTNTRSHPSTTAARTQLRAGVVDVTAGESSFDFSTFDLNTWLARHGVSLLHAFKTARESGSALLDAAHAVGADLIEMGTWSHSRIAEIVLGGATRHHFHYSDLPLLMAR